MAANEISLGFPDSQTVEVFMDGKHIATMTNAPGYEDGIPMELFDLMRAAPDMLTACKRVLSYWNCGPRIVDGVDVDDVVKAAVQKAEGASDASNKA